MKTEYQEVYIAFDGKQFLDEKECFDYEIELVKEIPIGVELRDVTGEVRPLTFFIENDFSDLYGMHFFRETEKERFRGFINEDPNFGDIDWEEDCLHYVYNADIAMWINAKEFYFDLVNQARAFKIKWGVVD